MPGALSSRESGSVVLIFPVGVAGTWWGLGGPPPKAAPVARDPAGAVGLVGLGRPALVEALTRVALPAAAALVFRPAARHRRRLVGRWRWIRCRLLIECLP